MTHLKHKLAITATDGHIWLQFPGGLKYGFQHTEVDELQTALDDALTELAEQDRLRRIRDEVRKIQRPDLLTGARLANYIMGLQVLAGEQPLPQPNLTLVNSKRRNERRKWNHIDAETAWDMSQNCYTYAEIAEHLGRTRRAVANQLSKMRQMREAVSA